MDRDTTKLSNAAKNSSYFQTPTLFNLSGFNGMKVKLRFNAEQVSSYGGLLLLKEFENQIGIIRTWLYASKIPVTQVMSGIVWRIC